MTRFTGWSENAVKKLGVKPESVKKVSKHPDYPALIAAALELLGIECEREYKFLHDRRFRFDLVVLPISTKLAIEFDGAVYTRGRHTRPTGFINDAKKLNLATMHGWKLLRYTTADTKEAGWENKIAEEIANFIQGKK